MVGDNIKGLGSQITRRTNKVNMVQLTIKNKAGMIILMIVTDRLVARGT